MLSVILYSTIIAVTLSGIIGLTLHFLVKNNTITYDSGWKSFEILTKVIGFIAVTCTTYIFINLEIEKSIEKSLRFEYLSKFPIEIQEQYEKCALIVHKLFVVLTENAKNTGMHTYNLRIGETPTENYQTIIADAHLSKMNANEFATKYQTCQKIINSRIETASQFLRARSQVEAATIKTKEDRQKIKEDWEISRDSEAVEIAKYTQDIIEQKIWSGHIYTKDEVISYLTSLQITYRDDYAFWTLVKEFEYHEFENQMKVITSIIDE